MNRTSINPTEWGLAFQMDQGELVEGHTKLLHCSGQCAIAEDTSAELGVKVVNPDDMRSQMEVSLANIDAVLEKAGMTRANLTSLRFFTTDVDEFLGNYDVYAKWIAEAGIRPPQSLIGISRLVFPSLKVEIEATAAQ